MSKTQLGWVYVLHNPSFRANMIKIGFTNRPTPQQRAQELSKHTGVPTEFKVVYAVKVANAQQVEGKIHQILQHKRARNNREFFECSIAEAVQTIKSVAGRQIVETLDYRKGQPEKAKPQPKPQAKANPSRPKPKSKPQKGNKMKFFIVLLALFFGAMLYVGMKTEAAEQAQNPTPKHITTPHKPTTTQQPENLPPTSTAYLQTENARQTMQLAWDKIPHDIQKELENEQNQWLKQTQQTCQQKNDCLIKAYEKRAAYLQGYSIR